jgi:hypothetical protein
MVPLPAEALAASVVLCPIQMLAGEADGVSDGLAPFILTDIVPAAEHRFELVTVTV